MNNEIIAFSNQKSNNKDQDDINIQWKKHFALQRRNNSISNKENDQKKQLRDLNYQKKSLKLKYLTLEQETKNNLNEKDINIRRVKMIY